VTHAQTTTQAPPAPPAAPPAHPTVGVRYIGGTPTGPPTVTSYATLEGRTRLVPVVAPPAELALDPFYKKYVDADGIPVVSSENVADDALWLARDIVNYMLQKRADVRKVMVDRKSRLLVMAISEGETDLPERRDWTRPAITDRRLTARERETYNAPTGIANMTDKQYWDNRARGMGGNVTSCAEENLLGIPGTRYYGEHITVHEFSHNVMGALRVADSELYAQIQPAYEAAKAKGLYKSWPRGNEQYAINTVAEYFAEGTQWWFWSNFEFYDFTTKARVQSPDDLKAYDPTLFGILEKIYAGHHIPADVYHGKNLRPATRPN
jgi:hypothetical protein